jgi:hypothetical protein
VFVVHDKSISTIQIGRLQSRTFQIYYCEPLKLQETISSVILFVRVFQDISKMFIGRDLLRSSSCSVYQTLFLYSMLSKYRERLDFVLFSKDVMLCV